MRLDVAHVALAGTLAGFGGFLLEDAFVGPRYSEVFGPGNRIPFLPVYAAGGALVAGLTPLLSNQPWYVRGAAYAAILGLLEASAGMLERAEGRASWDYEGDVIDVKHVLLWGALGLGAETALALLPTSRDT